MSNVGVDLAQQQCGFRRDPMDFVHNSPTLEAAVVRRAVFGKARPGDEQLLRRRIDELLADQAEDGALVAHPLHRVSLTGTVLLELLELGAQADEPGIKRAIEFIRRTGGKDPGDEVMSSYNAQALVLLGLADQPGVGPAIADLLDRQDEWIAPESMCPWTPAVQIKTVWDCRRLDGRCMDVVGRGLEGIVGGLNLAGCCGGDDPWGFLDAAGYVDHPAGRAIVYRQLPMILRSQRGDGGWGSHSLAVFRALHKHGLLEPLRKRPAMGPDFEVVRSIPAPAGRPSDLAFDGERLWVLETGSNAAIAISPQSGKVLRKLAMPVANVRGLAFRNGRLAVTTQQPEQPEWEDNAKARQLVEIDPESGEIVARTDLPLNNVAGLAQVGDKLLVADVFQNAVGIFDGTDWSMRKMRWLGAPGVTRLAAQDGSVWHSDWLLPGLIFRSDLSGRLLAWGASPFEGEVGGLAWDGERLWAIDVAGGRICALRSTGPARETGEGGGQVRRQGERVWVEGVSGGQVGDRWDMLLRASQIVLRHRGREVSLEELMACSGDAFHLCHGMRWQEMAYMMIPTDTMANLTEAQGFQGQWVWARSTDEAELRNETQQVLERIRREIDAGRPVMAGGCADRGCAPWSVVVGYEGQGERLCHVGMGEPYRWAGVRGIALDFDPTNGFWNGRLRGKLGRRTGGWLNDLCYIWGQDVSPPGERELVLAVLTRAVELSHAAPFFVRGQGGPEFRYGQQAYEGWAKDLRELDYPADLEKSPPSETQEYDMGNIDTQVDQVVRGRTAAALFCERAAIAMPESAKQLRAAADAYRQEVAIARQAFDVFIPAFDGNDEPRVNWLKSQDKREAGAAAIERMLAKERLAIAQITSALAAEGASIPAIATASASDLRSSTPDYAGLRLEGNGHTQDTFSLTIQAAASLLGREVDYERVYCLSGNAFAPGIDKNEDCTAWWHVQGWMSHLGAETVGAALGLDIKRLDLGPNNLSPADAPEVFQRKALAVRKKAAPAIREAMDSGKVVITSSGWRAHSNGEFVPWCWWGVITHAGDDGVISGACVKAEPGKCLGAKGRELDYTDTWTVSLTEPSLAAHEADVAMLNNAIARIRGTGQYKADRVTCHGLEAMDAWIAQMSKLPFCPSCEHAGAEGMAGCAVNNAQTTTAGAKAAASQLRKCSDGFPPVARGHLEAAARRYDRIVELLAPARWGFYREILNDLDKQKEHAKVLEQVKAQFALAADEMDKAVAAEDKAK